MSGDPNNPTPGEKLTVRIFQITFIAIPALALVAMVIHAVANHG